MGKRAKPATIISASLGIAGYLVAMGLDMAGVTLSLGWAIVLWAISGGLILFAGFIAFKVYLWPILRRIRLQWPITTHHTKSMPQSMSATLSQEEVAERHAFIQQLRAVVERLLKNSQGAETRSIKSIAHDICSETPVRQYITSDGLAGQTDRLLTHQLDDFFIRVSNYQRQVEGLSVGNLDDTNINSICNTTRELVFDYRRLVDEVMVMLTNLENRGVKALWHKAPWSVRIHRELSDNYDELMRLVVDLKTVTPSYARDLLPKDDQTSKFKRASLWS